MSNIIKKREWTLFLDRDGVINKKLDNDYVKNWNEFIFLNRSIEAISILTLLFTRILIVTNQRGVGKGLMTKEALYFIHEKMLGSIRKANGDIKKIYFATDINEESFYRKPNSGMAFQSKRDFPDIKFEKSVMVGDSQSDMAFGKNLNMFTVLITASSTSKGVADIYFESLFDVAKYFANNIKG